MALNSINTNIAAYFAQSNINSANTATSSSIGRLSSGNRIVRASDDVAAMSVGTSLRTTVTTLKMGLLNASQGSSMLQVADGALGKVQDMLLRQKALATQATSGSLTSSERGFLDQEFQNLTNEIDRLVQNTNFNGVNILDGTLGATADLVALDAQALLFTADDGLVVGADAYEAINIETNAAAIGAGAGQLQFVASDNATQLADGQYLAVNTAVYGEIGQITMSNVNVGVSAELSVDINGVTFTGTIANNGTSAVLRNGETRIQFGTAAFSIASEASANVALNTMNASFDNVVIMQNRTVRGVDFSGTRLDGVTMDAALGGPAIRTADPSNVGVSNFKYTGNAGAANTNTLSVEIGGETYTAVNLEDNIVAGSRLTFTNGKQEGMQIILTGLTTPIVNIRTSSVDREAFISALNDAFAGAGGGVDFALGQEASDKLTVSVASASSTSLYGGQSLNVQTVSAAQAAGETLNNAIDMVTSIRANVGAQMSRFDYATANIEISMQNQDAARGTLLDTDVAAESSAYATAQVQLQAGIAVLAQANQLPQNLLKLIG